MNCQDIGRILDSGRFSTLSASERHDAVVHAKSCRHCAPRWGVHSRMADMPIAPMPQELAAQIQALVASRARANVLRFVSRQMMVVIGGFVVLAAAAAVVTVKYVAPALQRADDRAQQRERAVETEPVVTPATVLRLPAPLAAPPTTATPVPVPPTSVEWTAATLKYAEKADPDPALSREIEQAIQTSLNTNLDSRRYDAQSIKCRGKTCQILLVDRTPLVGRAPSEENPVHHAVAMILRDLDEGPIRNTSTGLQLGNPMLEAVMSQKDGGTVALIGFEGAKN